MKKVLFISSYSGSSAYIYSLIKEDVPFSYKLIVDKVGQDLFNDKRIAVDYNFNNGSLSPEEIIKKESPDAIFVVSQWSPNIEKKFIKIGRKHRIPAISAIENWLCYLERFSETDELKIVRENVYLPDYIFVIDELAKYEMIKDGIPEERIIVTGQPAFDKTLEEYKILSLQTFKIKERLNIPYNFEIVTFVAESLTKDFGNRLGYDEQTTLEFLGNTMEEIIRQDNKLNIYLIVNYPPASWRASESKNLNKMVL